MSNWEEREERRDARFITEDQHFFVTQKKFKKNRLTQFSTHDSIFFLCCPWIFTRKSHKIENPCQNEWFVKHQHGDIIINIKTLRSFGYLLKKIYFIRQTESVSSSDVYFFFLLLANRRRREREWDKMMKMNIWF